MRIRINARLNAMFIGVLILTGLSGQSLMAAPTVVRVGTCENATNTILTIQAGVNAAPAGATVRVCPGTYREQVEITRPLTLTGVRSGNLDAAIVTSPSSPGVLANASSYLDPASSPYLFPTAAQIWVNNTTGVTINNLTVDGSNNGILDCSTFLFGIYFENASGTVQNVATRNQTTPAGCGNGVGMWAESAPGQRAAVSFEGNSVQSFDGAAILARGAGTTAEIESNSVLGPGSLNYGMNEVSMSHGATGTIKGNSVIDALVTGLAPDDLADGSCGIAIGGSQGVTISGNTVGNTQCGIGLYNANNNVIISNNVFGTRVNDGVYVCGNKNQIVNNTILGSDQAGVHFSCSETFPSSTANNNVALNNTINGACAGILLHSGTTGNVALVNNFLNTTNVIKTANTCP